MATIGKVSAVFTASSSGLRTGVNQASRSMKQMEGSVKSLQGSMRALVAINGAQLFGSVVSGAGTAAAAIGDFARSAFAGLRQSVDLATTLGEETSKSGVIFGNAAGQVGQFAAEAERIGLSEAGALQATGAFGNLFTAMGLGQQQAADYAVTMTSLGADLASFNNATVEESIQAIGAALRGEAEPIRRFGVLLDESTLKQKAMEMGLVDATAKGLTPAIKAQAAYAAILDQTAKAQGDFERTSGSLANLGRIVQAQTTNIFTDIGSAFEPLFQSATSAISSSLSAVRPFIQEVSTGVKSSIETIGVALQNLVPAFEGFLGTLDGGSVGERIGEGILQGARFFAEVADLFVAQAGPLFDYFSRIGQQWAAMWDIGQRVAAFFGGVFDVAKGTFLTVVGIFSGITEGLLRAVREGASVLGFDTSTLDTLIAGAAGFNAEISKGITENFNSAGENFSRVFGDSSKKAGEDLAGPFTAALDAATRRSREAAAARQEALNAKVDVKTAVTVDATPIKEAVKGIDSRSAEGIREMFRIMRGPQRDDIQERQLAAQEETARNTRRFLDNAEDEPDVVELAPAAGG